ncbi:hypothetical protein HYH03_003926 [Edaphochlamys debaryana]|uniref:Peptidase M14 domain-containing protein n=1 Tax=Edaphochlamys debaryana TaxID=47281 RepID=A0A835YG94_9CHLO|nr:hypothetical protein HYH03_003926 [Edaphochlamys debaryana]|eukprot:KAG2498170.1 hypothetical protein HYH03_003926 [Edaphochlamys debaryana]
MGRVAATTLTPLLLLSLLAVQAGGHGQYSTLGDLLHWYTRFAQTHSSVLRFEELKEPGFEQSPSLPVATFTNTSVSQSGKALAVLVFGEHARELITCEVGLWLSRVLVGDTAELFAWKEWAEAFQPLGVAPEAVAGTVAQWVRRILDGLVVKLLPVENVDGRQAWEGGNLCLRKTARGVDLNRNYKFAFAHEVPTHSDMYGGPHAFSEPQSRLITRLALGGGKGAGPVAKAYVNVHSGEWAVYSGWDSKAAVGPGMPADLDDLLQKSGKICNCQAGPAGAVSNYLAYGTGMDFMYTQLGVPYALTYEVYGGDGAGLLRNGRTNAALGSWTYAEDPGIAKALPKPEELFPAQVGHHHLSEHQHHQKHRKAAQDHLERLFEKARSARSARRAAWEQQAAADELAAGDSSAAVEGAAGLRRRRASGLRRMYGQRRAAGERGRGLIGAEEEAARHRLDRGEEEAGSDWQVEDRYEESYDESYEYEEHVDQELSDLEQQERAAEATWEAQSQSRSRSGAEAAAEAEAQQLEEEGEEGYDEAWEVDGDEAGAWEEGLISEEEAEAQEEAALEAEAVRDRGQGRGGAEAELQLGWTAGGGAWRRGRALRQETDGGVILNMVRSKPSYLQRCFDTFNPPPGPAYRTAVAKWVVMLLMTLDHAADPANPKPVTHSLAGTVLAGRTPADYTFGAAGAAAIGRRLAEQAAEMAAAAGGAEGVRRREASETVGVEEPGVAATVTAAEGRGGRQLRQQQAERLGSVPIRGLSRSLLGLGGQARRGSGGAETEAARRALLQDQADGIPGFGISDQQDDDYGNTQQSIAGLEDEIEMRIQEVLQVDPVIQRQHSVVVFFALCCLFAVFVPWWVYATSPGKAVVAGLGVAGRRTRSAGRLATLG